MADPSSALTPYTLTSFKTSPWNMETDEIAHQLQTDGERGLASSEATRRLEELGPNELDAEAAVPVWKKLLAQIQDPLIYLLFGAIAISLIAWMVEGAHGIPYEAVVIFIIVFLNAILGFVQESRAEQAVAALQKNGGRQCKCYSRWSGAAHSHNRSRAWRSDGACRR